MILCLTNVKHVQTTISNSIYSPIKVYSPSLAKRVQNIVFNIGMSNITNIQILWPYHRYHRIMNDRYLATLYLAAILSRTK